MSKTFAGAISARHIGKTIRVTKGGTDISGTLTNIDHDPKKFIGIGRRRNPHPSPAKSLIRLSFGGIIVALDYGDEVEVIE